MIDILYLLTESGNIEKSISSKISIAAMHTIKCYVQINKFSKSWATSIYNNLKEVQTAISSNKNLFKLLSEKDIISENKMYIISLAIDETKSDKRKIQMYYEVFRSTFNTYSFVYDLNKVKNVIDGLITNSFLPDNRKKEFLEINESIYNGKDNT